MGYSVRITPSNGRTGFLQRGALAPAWSIGTYYPNPCHARVAAISWIKRHPGGRAEILKFKTKEPIEVFC